MSRTLFWYILRDLLRIFLMAALVLAGIMSFGGLVRPLTEHGLGAGQAAKVLVYLLPAMQTYALPVAALFATTIVYGRLSADNELTACRASGISHWALATPALVLGLLISLASLGCLCFLSPHYMLKAEKVVFSNLAEVVKRKIDRAHQIAMGDFTIFANSAEVHPAPPASREQVVTLHGVVFVSYDSPRASRALELPSVFWTADSATAFIRQRGDGVELRAQLVGGMKIDARAGAEGATEQAVFGPVAVPSPIRERMQFMDVRVLRDLREDPGRGRHVRDQLERLLRRQIQEDYLRRIAQALKSQRAFRFQGDETWTLERGEAQVVGGEGELTVRSRESAQTQQVKLARQGTSGTSLDRAFEATVQVDVIPAGHEPSTHMRLAIVLKDAILDAGGEHSPHHDVFRGRRMTLPIPADLAALQKQGLRTVLESAKPSRLKELYGELDRLAARVASEIHARASFSVSCLILVMLGCTLGMMFRSGDFLTAFALSAMPALLSIALISTGQHIGEGSLKDLPMGIAWIWSGNLLVLGLVWTLLWRLHRQ